MINVWDYANKMPKVNIETVDGEQFSGKVIDVIDGEEFEFPEDALSVESQSDGIKIFLQSNIKTLEVVL